MNGFLKIQRKFFSHWIWEEKRTFSKAEAWFDLLQMAAFKPTKRVIRGHLIELNIGECVASLRYLSTRWNWGKDKISRFMLLLEADEMLRRETRHGETVITLCNYRDYMSVDSVERDSDTDKHETEARQERDRGETNMKKDKKDKKDKKGNSEVESTQKFKPSLDDFTDYLLTRMPKVNPEWTPSRIKRAAELQYETYQNTITGKSPSWKDGHGNVIKNWKTKAVNALTHKKPWNYGNAQEPKTEKLFRTV